MAAQGARATASRGQERGGVNRLIPVDRSGLNQASAKAKKYASFVKKMHGSCKLSRPNEIPRRSPDHQRKRFEVDPKTKNREDEHPQNRPVMTKDSECRACRGFFQKHRLENAGSPPGVAWPMTTVAQESFDSS